MEKQIIKGVQIHERDICKGRAPRCVSCQNSSLPFLFLCKVVVIMGIFHQKRSSVISSIGAEESSTRTFHDVMQIRETSRSKREAYLNSKCSSCFWLSEVPRRLQGQQLNKCFYGANSPASPDISSNYALSVYVKWLVTLIPWCVCTFFLRL